MKKEFLQKLLQYNNILIAIHVHPDGDCIGAALALHRVLKKQFNKKVTVFSKDPIPESCKFLPNIYNIINKEKPDNYDLLLLADVNSVKRTQLPESMLNDNIFIIDHHERIDFPHNEDIINSNASSACEIIYDFFKENNIEIDKTVAEYLMTGIICDTGSFVFSNTTAKVFLIASQLTELGANSAIITKKYFKDKPISSLKVLGQVLNNLKTFCNNQIVIGYLDYDFFINNPGISIDSDSINEQLQSVKGHKLSVFLRETEPNKIRGSLRSPNTVDCNKIAMIFDGGGHKNAAGCTINMSLEKAIDIIVKEGAKAVINDD